MKRPQRLEAGSMLIEMCLCLGLLLLLAFFGLMLGRQGLLGQQWVVLQTMADARLSVESAFAQRYPYDEIVSSGRWPLSPSMSREAVVLGRTPTENVRGEVVRYRTEVVDSVSGMQSFELISNVVVSNSTRTYVKTRKVYRSR